jgi:uncharacterized protein involved in exopolysaccharide biosynthesis/Mrp family chromosome partitioning ATPase
MNERYVTIPGPGITFADVLFAIFRHKWKILVMAGAGIIAAAVLPFVMPSMYQSEAKLFVKYVVESKSPGQVGSASLVTADEGNAINTEMEILTSLDLAQQVADLVGPEKILAKAGGGTNRYVAAALIHKNLIPDAAKGSKVIRVTFKHRDPDVVQSVLKQVIDAYLTRHEEVHRHVGAFDEFLTQQTDQLKSRLKETEEELRKAKSSAGIISLDDSKKAFAEQISSIQGKITEAEAELAERKATAEEMAKLLHTTAPSLTNDLAHTNEVTASPEKIAEYKKICTLLDGLRKREQDLLMQFSPEASFVKRNEELIATNEKKKEQLEEENPSLAGVRPEVRDTQDASTGLRATLLTETARAKALQAKIDLLTTQLLKIRKEAGTIDSAEAEITELQRKQKLQEKNYEYFAENLEQSHFDQALGAGRTYNISVIQAPSPNFVVSKLPKVMAMVALGGIGLALGLAFLIEFYFDKSIKRPAEVGSKLNLPLFISIPRLSWGNHNALKNGKSKGLLPERSAVPNPNADKGAAASATITKTQATVANGSHDAEIAPWDPHHVLRPFCEALRDRLITFFDLNNLTHKPKLVAVTSCSEGAGVSTVATGLAASLSETGEGNVLLVNMGEKNGAVHQFYKGDLACGLDDALEKNSRESALVSDKLYVVSETSDNNGLPLPLPRRFKHLMPKLRASDFDYIIFDMPAVTQVSATPRLARFMDFVVMVVESENNNRDLVKQACSLLSETKTNVGVVLNKGRNYLPKWLSQEL